jgi:predicted metal-dependent HD superfamily phosphohydrolase
MLDETRWNNLVSGLCERLVQDEYFSALAAAYSEPHRHYHNTSHIEHCLREFDSTRTLAEHPEAVEFAIWLHDAVYNPRDDDNEEKSAKWAADVLASLGCTQTVVVRVADLILATKHHVPLHDPDARLIVDIDLSILGQPPDVYDNYEESIRAEYAWATAATYRVGRWRVLRGFSQRFRIFQTDRFFTLYEKQARQNLARTVAGLGQIRDDLWGST